MAVIILGTEYNIFRYVNDKRQLRSQTFLCLYIVNDDLARKQLTFSYRREGNAVFRAAPKKLK